VDLQGLTQKETIFEFVADRIVGSGILVDISGENRLTYSQDYQSAWTKYQATVSESEAAPDGTSTASVIKEDATNNQRYISQTFSSTAGTKYVFSCFVKKETRDYFVIQIYRSGDQVVGWVNLNTGAVSNLAGGTITVTPVGNGWWRIAATRLVTTSGVGMMLMLEPADVAGATVYQGVLNQRAVTVWGAQLNICADGYDINPGIYTPTVGVPNPRFLAGPNGAPLLVDFPMVKANGDPLAARYFPDNGNHCYSINYDSAFIWPSYETDFYFCALFTMVTSASDRYLYKSSTANNGLEILIPANQSYVRAIFRGAGGTYQNVDSPVISSGMPILYQLFRSGTTAVAWANGSFGSSQTVTNLGLSTSDNIRIGGLITGSNSINSLAYLRFDQVDASTYTRLRDRQRLMGLAGPQDVAIDTLPTVFTRGNWAFVTNPDRTLSMMAPGLPRVETQKRQNLLYQSNTFNTTWSLTRASVSGTSVTLPDGASGTVNTIKEDNQTGTHLIYQGTAGIPTRSGKHYIFSAYLKAANRNWVRLGVYCSDWYAAAWFDLTNGVVGTISTGSARIESVGNGWYRCSVWGTCAGVTYDGTECNIAAANADNSNSFVGLNQDSIYVAWAQLEETPYNQNIGVAPGAYTPTTTLTVDRKESSVLIEQAGDNKLLYSQVVGNASWNKNFVTVTQNAALAPDGNWTGSKVVEDGTTGQHWTGQALTYTTDTNYISSAFFKYIPGGRQYVCIADSFLPNLAVFDIKNGVVKSKEPLFTNYGIEPYTNGWYRCWASWTKGSGTASPGYFGASNSVGGWNIVGLNGDSFYIWGAQVSTGQASANNDPHVTSLIPTVGTAGSRAGDLLTYSLASLMPASISASTNLKKFGIQFTARALYKDSNEIDNLHSFLEISGNTGTAAYNRNRFALYSTTNDAVVYSLWDNASAQKGGSKDPMPWDLRQWHTYMCIFDLGNLANSLIYFDGVSQSHFMTGSISVFDLANVLLRIGGFCDGTPVGDMQIRDLYVWPA
jgi:hypothetical protein